MIIHEQQCKDQPGKTWSDLQFRIFFGRNFGGFALDFHVWKKTEGKKNLGFECLKWALMTLTDCNCGFFFFTWMSFQNVQLIQLNQ